MPLQIEKGHPLFEPLSFILVLCLTVRYFYSVPRWKHLITSIRAIYFEGTRAEISGTPKPGHIEPGEEPHVTVVICAYNEGAVVLKTIESACSIDWPRDKLTVHVCDDSTDKQSIMLASNAVALWRSRGINIERLTRPDRLGYKAGNLRYNFPRHRGDFVAYFDADHRAERDFLKNTIPYFFDQSGMPRAKVALVQTPWAYYNTHQNLLTECDSFGLDIHHVCEQVGRSINYRVFGFNGTGGVWRRRAIEDAGGFSWETVTEDIMLSYKAYMKGYELLYVRHHPQCLEVPADILAHIQQKSRWTKGFLQVFRIFRWTLLLSPKVPFSVTYEFFAHVLASFNLLFYAITYILYPHLKVATLLNSWVFKLIFLSQGLDALLTAVHGQTAKVPASNGHYRSIWSRIARVGLYVPYYMLQMGMTFFEAKAALEGTYSDDATFLTTPKAGARNSVKKVWADDLVAYLGLLVALHQIVFQFLNDPFQEIDSFVIRFSMRFWNVCFVLGLLGVSVSFLWAKYHRVAQVVAGQCAGMALTAAVAAAVALDGFP